MLPLRDPGTARRYRTAQPDAVQKEVAIEVATTTRAALATADRPINGQEVKAA